MRMNGSWLNHNPKALLLNTYVNFIGTQTFKPQYQPKAKSFRSAVLDYFPKRSARSLHVRWTPAWSVHFQRVLLHIFLVEDAVPWMERCVQTTLIHGSVGTVGSITLASFITQLLALGFVQSGHNSLPNNDKCLHPCDCCPEEPTSANEQLHPQRTISRVDFYTYLGASIILQQVQLPWCKCYILISFYGCIHPISSVSTELDEASSAKEEAHMHGQKERDDGWLHTCGE